MAERHLRQRARAPPHHQPQSQPDQPRARTQSQPQPQPQRRHSSSSSSGTTTPCIISIVVLFAALFFALVPLVQVDLFTLFSTTSAQDGAPAALTPSDTSTMATAAAFTRATPLVIPPAGRHTATVIFSHGLGDSGHGWMSAVEHWRTKNRLNEVKFVLPNAPQIPISVNGGMRMPGWFDLKTLGTVDPDMESISANEDTTGILAAQKYIHSLIQDEISAGIPADRVVIGGFSQGGALSLFSGLTAPFRIGGIVGLSSWLLMRQGFKSHVPEDDFNKGTPIFMGHGSNDPLVRYDWGKETERVLGVMGYEVEFKTYNGMEHSACLEELDDVERYLVSRLPAQG